MDPDITTKFDELKQQIKKLETFLNEQMATKQDVKDALKNSISELPTKDDYKNLVSKIDAYAQEVKNKSN